MNKIMKLTTALTSAVMIMSISATVTAYDLSNRDGRFYVETDRYTRVAADIRQDQLRPLEAIVTVSFSNNIETVGDAVNELLEGSGYRWGVSQEPGADEIIQSLPLPLVVRDIGPVTLREALVTIVGPAWNMQVNELKRVVSFSVIDQYQETTTVPSIQVLGSE